MSYHRLAYLFLAVFLMTGLNSAFPQDEVERYKDTRIETIDVADGIYMLMGEGGNIGISTGEDGVFMVDDQFAPLTDRIIAAVAKLSDQPVRFVINTHWHFDHTGGNENLGKEGVVIVAHDNVYKRMSADSFIKAFNMQIPAAPKAALPVITFNDTVSFHLNGLEIVVVHQESAHTDGDSIVFFKTANVIHMGDTFFNGIYPFIDSSSGGNVNGMIRSAENVLALSDEKTKIIPGHGPLADKAALEKYRDMLVMVRDRMQSLIDDGKTLDEIINMKPNADLDEGWGGGFLDPEAFLKVLHSTMPGSQTG